MRVGGLCQQDEWMDEYFLIQDQDIRVYWMTSYTAELHPSLSLSFSNYTLDPTLISPPRYWYCISEGSKVYNYCLLYSLVLVWGQTT